MNDTCARCGWYAPNHSGTCDRTTFEMMLVLRELVDTLPKCDFCDQPATRAFDRGGARYCDVHGVGVECTDPGYLVKQDAPDYPRAPALRKALELLKGRDK